MMTTATLLDPVREGAKVWGRGDYVREDPSRWVVIFPHYLDSSRKRVEGRKIARDKAVERPDAGEVFEAVRQLGLRAQLELDKSYCRDCWVPGRVRVQIVDSEKLPLSPEIANRTLLKSGEQYRDMANSVCPDRCRGLQTNLSYH
jgi:signal recognition particle subunit SRP19